MCWLNDLLLCDARTNASQRQEPKRDRINPSEWQNMMHVTCYNGNRNQMGKKSTKTIVGFISTYFKLIDFAHLSRSASTQTSKRLDSFSSSVHFRFLLYSMTTKFFFANPKCLWKRKIICPQHFINQIKIFIFIIVYSIKLIFRTTIASCYIFEQIIGCSNWIWTHSKKIQSKQ